MRLRHLTSRDFLRQPWRNGGGHTTELAVQAEGDRWLWRLSIADVGSSGPFSDFSGYERTIMLIEGAGMELTFEGHPPMRIDRAFVPWVFGGAWRTHCRLLNGPVRDLNLILDPARVRGMMSVILLENVLDLELGETSLLYGLVGAAWIEHKGLHRLEAGQLIRIDEAQQVRLRLRPFPTDCRIVHVVLT